MNEPVQAMKALAEAGAIGAMLFDSTGGVVAHSMPAFYPSDSLRSAGERITVLLETMSENFEPIAELVLGFEGHLLMLRRSTEAVLVVVMPETANREAVKMATNIVFRRLTAPAPRGPANPPPFPARAAPPPTPKRPVAAAATASPKPKKKSDIWGD